jgi:hypothetical protein
MSGHALIVVLRCYGAADDAALGMIADVAEVGGVRVEWKEILGSVS